MNNPTRLTSPTQLQAAESVIIVLPQNPTLPQIASGLSLFLLLEKSGKRVEVGCSTPMLVEANRLVGIQKIKTKLAGENLVISFDYVKDAIEKVSYNVDNGKFNLVVVPKTGHQSLDPKSVTYQQSGINSDTIILIGTQEIEQTGDILPQDEAAKSTNILALLADNEKTLASQVALLISGLGIGPDADTASNLFQGLIAETQSFSTASAIDFETAAALVRAGAQTSPPTSISLATPDNGALTPQSSWLKPKVFSSAES